MYLDKLKEMFSKMVLKKDHSLIPVFYHQDFLLYSNNKITDYDTFLKTHIEYYNSSIKYEIKYDENTFLENNDKVSGRMWITIVTPKQKAKTIEVILIAQYKENKIYRVWELTFPDWSQLPEFS